MARGLLAVTVPAMVIVLLLAALSAAAGAVLGPRSLLAAPADLFVDITGQAMGALVHRVADTAGWAHEPSVALATALASCAAPGLLCLTLAEAATVGRHMRRMAAALLILSALACFAAVPAPTAAVLLLLSLPAAALLAVAPGRWATIPLVCTAAFLGARVVVHAVAAASTRTVVADLDALLPLGNGWSVVFAVAAAAPVAAAAVRLTRR